MIKSATRTLDRNCDQGGGYDGVAEQGSTKKLYRKPGEEAKVT
jgi:hypothetical protein